MGKIFVLQDYSSEKTIINDLPLNEKGLIIFKDKAVEQILLSSSLTNPSRRSDGVTKIDLENMEGIQSVFTNSTTIVDFPELDYMVNQVTIPAMNKNKGLRSIGLRNIQYLPTSCFAGCALEGEIRMPSLAGSLALGAFRETNISKIINLGKLSSFASIGSVAVAPFGNCPNLTTIVLPKTISFLPNNVFGQTSALTEIVLLSEDLVTLQSQYVIHSSSSPNLVSIYVPDYLVNSYKSAQYWSTYAAKIKPLSTYSGVLE